MKQIKLWAGIILCFIVAGMCTVSSTAQQNDSPYRVGYSFMDGQWVENRIYTVENEQVKAERKLLVSDNSIHDEMNAEKSSSNQCGDTLYWTLDANGVMTISGTGDMWDFRNEPVFNDTYHECPWESRKSEIKSVKFEDGITYIGADAFANCTNLKNITFSDTITVIGSFAFLRCANLENFVLPAELRTLGQQCFDGCKKITKVTIPDTVNFLGSRIFHEASSLTDLYIGGSLDAPGYVCANNCIGGCTSLEEFKVSPNNIALTVVDGVLYSKNKDILVQYPLGKKDKKIVLPDTLKSVGELTVDGALYLEEIVFPEGLEEVGVCAFSSMPKLKYLSYPSTMREIGEYNGERCNEITYIENKSATIIPLSNENSAVWLDENDKQITSMGKGIAYKKGTPFGVELKDSTISLGIGESVTIPDKISYWDTKLREDRGDLIFSSSKPEVAEVSKDGKIVAKSVGETKITIKNRYQNPYSDNTFTATCTVSVVKNIAGAKVSSIKTQTYTGKAIKPVVTVTCDGKTLTKDTDYIVSYKKNKNIGTATVVIKGKGSYGGTLKKEFKIGVKKGGIYTVDNATYMITNKKTDGNGTVTLKGITNGTKVKNVTVKKEVKIGGVKFKITAIGDEAFKKCMKLKKVVIGENVKAIGKEAFFGNGKLKTIVLKSTNLKSIRKNAINGINPKAKIMVPVSKVKKYKKMFKKSGGYKKTMKVVGI